MVNRSLKPPPGSRGIMLRAAKPELASPLHNTHGQNIMTARHCQHSMITAVRIFLQRHTRFGALIQLLDVDIDQPV